MNGGIVSNKGFIKQFAAPGTKVIAGTYISAWGGIQSAGQFVGQVVSSILDNDTKTWSLRNVLILVQFLQFATDRFGRKVALYILWLFLAGVSLFN